MYSNQESTQSPRQICHSCDILVICLFLRFRALYNKEMKKELLKQLYLIKKTRNSARDVLTYIFGIVFFFLTPLKIGLILTSRKQALKA